MARTHTGILFGLLLTVGGCGGMQLDRPLRPQETDWPTFARTTSHISVAPQPVALPLTLEWEYSLTAGTGSGSPLVADAILLIGNLRGELHAVNVWNGKRIGWVALGEAIHGAPVIDGSLVIVPLANTRESLVAFDLFNGKPRWKQQYGDIEVSLLLYDQKLFLANTAGFFFCADRATGVEKWRFEIPDNTKLKGIRSSPAADSSIVVFGADDGSLYALDAQTGKMRWKHGSDAPVVAAPAIAAGRVVVGNLHGLVRALDLLSGRLLWTYAAGAPVFGHTLMVDDLAVVVTVAGTMTGLSAADGSVVWTINAGGPMNAGAAAAGGVIFAGTLNREIVAVRATDGVILGKTPAGGRIKSPPVIAQERVFVATDDKSLLSFRGAKP
jgi:outer membrane protein assembly factor BamB